ncbi:MAG: ABC transporter substrate-binding protein [Candidatus Nealsonbacteria bacterium]|nr:MAG: ABC transporter substrate-binding protein [Candidatus Nealsonbacteria bacterium]
MNITESKVTKYIGLLIILMMLIISLSCSVLAKEEDIFNIGVVTSLTGEFAKGGEITVRGYNFWADAVNEQGGILIGDKRYKVKLIYLDDRSDNATAAKATERLALIEKVDLILGPFGDTTIACVPICEKYSIPMIDGSCEAPQLWEMQPEWVFGTCPAGPMNIKGPLDMLNEKLVSKIKTFAVVGINRPYDSKTAEKAREIGEGFGWKLVDYEILPSGLADFSSIVTKIKKADPDLFVVSALLEDHFKIIPAMKDYNYFPKALVMHYGPTAPEFIDNLGEDAEYIIGASPWTPEMKLKGEFFGTAQEFAKNFKAAYGHFPDYTEAACGAAGIVAAEALKEIGATPPLSIEKRKELKDAIANVDIDTFYGRVKFMTEKGDKFYHCIELFPSAAQFQGGKLWVVGSEKEENIEKQLIYPAPSWEER